MLGPNVTTTTAGATTVTNDVMIVNPDLLDNPYQRISKIIPRQASSLVIQGIERVHFIDTEVSLVPKFFLQS